MQDATAKSSPDIAPLIRATLAVTPINYRHHALGGIPPERLEFGILPPTA